jgi:hypothetical protein
VSDRAGAGPAASFVQFQAAITAMCAACQAGGTGTATRSPVATRLIETCRDRDCLLWPPIAFGAVASVEPIVGRGSTSDAKGADPLASASYDGGGIFRRILPREHRPQVAAVALTRTRSPQFARTAAREVMRMRDD